MIEPVSRRTPGVVALQQPVMGAATVIVRKGQTGRLHDRVRAVYGIELPAGPRRVGCGGLAFTGMGSGRWLATRELGWRAFAAELVQTVGDLAAVCDQSGGLTVLRLTGSRARDALARIIPIDLHDRAFEPGCAASTVAAHIPITCWRRERSAEGWAVLEVAVARSFAASFWHLLSQSAAEFGFSGSLSRTDSSDEITPGFPCHPDDR